MFVIPAPVGMVRSDTACSGVAFRYPLARGDGPVHLDRSRIRLKLSPRAWGWSAEPVAPGGESGVIPSRVGMVRFRYNRLHLLDLL